MGNTVDINMLQVTPTESANSTKRTYLPAELYLPEWARDTEFFRNMCILLNYTENSLLGYSNPKYAMIEQCYKDIVFKYKDIMQLSEEALKAMLYEAGFSDILDALELSLEQLQMFVLYLPLFKALKGTDIGFNQVLSLLSHSYTLKTSITNPTELDNYTYELELITFLNVGFKANIASKLAKFSRSYVYPVLKRVTIQAMYRSLTPAVYGRPKIKKEIRVKCFEVPDILQQKYIPVFGTVKATKRIKVRVQED